MTAFSASGVVGRARSARGRIAPATAPRTPFVLLILVVLAAGLVLLLFVNTVTASGSFRARSLQLRNDALVLKQQELQRRIQSLSTPEHLAAAAAALGMVAGGDPTFIVIGPGGHTKVLGHPAPATVPPPPPPPPGGTNR